MLDLMYLRMDLEIQVIYDHFAYNLNFYTTNSLKITGRRHPPPYVVWKTLVFYQDFPYNTISKRIQFQRKMKNDAETVYVEFQKSPLSNSRKSGKLPGFWKKYGKSHKP